MRFLGVLLLAGCFGGAAAEPPLPAVAVAHIHDDGRIELEDGRTVRLFAVRPDARIVKSLRREVRDRPVTVDVILAGDPPAVELTVWHRGFSGCLPWTAGGDAGYYGHPIVINLFHNHAPPVLESDLDGVDETSSETAHWLVKSIRKDLARANGK